MYLTVHAKALNRASEILGGRDRLREFLRVPASHLTLWLSGAEKPPLDVFLKVVDLISGGPPVEAEDASELVLRARRLRRESGLLRVVVSRTRERSEQIQQSVLAARDLAARPRRPRSALAFLNTRFAVEHGKELVEGALDASIGAAGSEMGTLQLRTSEGLLIVAQRGFDKPFLDFFARVDGDDCACGSALKTGRRVVVPDVASHPLFAGTPAAPIMVGAGVRAVQSTPLLRESGEVLGVISTHYQVPREPSDRQLRVIDEIAARTAFWLDGGDA